jgi:serine/threonine protein kinase
VGKPAQQRSRHLAPGDRLGKYDLIRQIAIGGMAELYLARTTGIEGFEKLVVLKRILPQHATNQSFVDMFLNEARLAATLQHVNIAQVYDIGLEDGDYFFAMEYVHGEDLFHITSASVEQGVPVSMDAALTLATGLCAGLHYAHDKAGPEGKPLNIVHRDVSPSNVIISYDGAVKLVDFGIARASSRPGTTQGGLKGKIAYMSPEQCTSKATIDRRSDIFAVGTLLYELTTGRMPFVGETEYQVLNQIVNDDAPPPSKLVPDYPPALERIVMKALARDPERRHATALALQGALEDFAHENRLRVSPLVLGRLMGTLFPERIEEWAHAKAQGAFFVEQHVVRTLIEAGKTPDPIDSKLREQFAAERAAKEAVDATTERDDEDDDTTSVNNQAAVEPTDSTSIGPPPFEVTSSDDSARVPVPVAGSGYEPEPTPLPAAPHKTPLAIATPPLPPRPTTPPPAPVVPGLPGAVPIVSVAATAGTMVTPRTGTKLEDLLAEDKGEVTERVRAPARGLTEDTVHVRKKKKNVPVFTFVAAVLAFGAAAAIMFLLHSSDDASPKEPQPAPQVETPPPPVAPAAAPEPAPPPPPVEVKPEPPPPPPVEVKREPAPPPAAEPKPAPVADTKPAEPPATKPAPPKKVVHTAPAKPHAKPETKPVAKPAEPEPKETPKWNADSPFMPVRTEKH